MPCKLWTYYVKFRWWNQILYLFFYPPEIMQFWNPESCWIYFIRTWSVKITWWIYNSYLRWYAPQFCCRTLCSWIKRTQRILALHTTSYSGSRIGSNTRYVNSDFSRSFEFRVKRWAASHICKDWVLTYCLSLKSRTSLTVRTWILMVRYIMN